jgi:hypothetical protein
MLPASVTLGDPLYWNCLIEQVEKLSEQQRGVFLSMQNNFNYRSEVAVHGWYMGIAHTASVPCEDVNGLQARGIFPKASFINHACDPNTVRHWNTNIRKHTIHATRDIVQGQEITVDYLGTMEPRAPRQKHLRDNYKFDCLCRLCSLPPELSRLKDESFTELERLESLVARRGLTNNLTALESLRCVEAMVKIYDQPAPQGINMGPGQHQPVLPWVYGDAAKIALECSDLARAQMFLKRAVAGWRVSYGDDSQEVTENERYLENLTLHPHYSKNGLWRTSVDDVPRGINTAHLQDWLWRRAKLIDPAATRTMSPLRSRLAFPPAAHLPTDESLRLALRYYGFDQPLASRPRRHWCFLGEITSYAFEERLDVGVTDVDGKTVEINWHTRERGRELDDALVTEGNTIALLHAERRAETVRGQRFPIVKHEDHTKLLVSTARAPPVAPHHLTRPVPRYRFSPSDSKPCSQ